MKNIQSSQSKHLEIWGFDPSRFLFERRGIPPDDTGKPSNFSTRGLLPRELSARESGGVRPHLPLGVLVEVLPLREEAVHHLLVEAELALGLFARLLRLVSASKRGGESCRIVARAFVSDASPIEARERELQDRGSRFLSRMNLG